MPIGRSCVPTPVRKTLDTSLIKNLYNSNNNDQNESSYRTPHLNRNDKGRTHSTEHYSSETKTTNRTNGSNVVQKLQFNQQNQ